MRSAGEGAALQPALEYTLTCTATVGIVIFGRIRHNGREGLPSYALQVCPYIARRSNALTEVGIAECWLRCSMAVAGIRGRLRARSFNSATRCLGSGPVFACRGRRHSPAVDQPSMTGEYFRAERHEMAGPAIAQSDGVGTIFLNRLGRRNTLSLEFAGDRLAEPSLYIREGEHDGHVSVRTGRTVP